MDTCYKVVTNYLDRYFSHNVSPVDLRRIKQNCLPCGYIIEYKINKITLPYGNSKLFCFKDLNDAKDYARRYESSSWGHDKSVLKCRATGLEKYKYKSIPDCKSNGHSLIEIWDKLYSGMLDRINTQDTPNGTYLANSIEPVKLICTFYA